jgi:hypothetical protein
MMALGMGIGFEKNIPVGSMNAGVQKAVQSLQRSVQLTTSVNPDKTVGRIIRSLRIKDLITTDLNVSRGRLQKKMAISRYSWIRNG